MKKVLIVDDSQMNRIILTKMLGKEFNIVAASDGREALDIMNDDSNNILAVLLDLEMPKMNGYDVLRAMLGSENLSHIPVIICSGADDTGARQQVFAAGAVGLVVKPYNFAELISLLHNIIRVSQHSTAENGTVAKADDIQEWLELLSDMQAEKTAICEFNLTQNRFIRYHGNLFPEDVLSADSYDLFIRNWTEKYVFADDRAHILEFLGRENLLSINSRGILDGGIDYRAVFAGEIRRCNLCLRFIAGDCGSDIRVIMAHIDIHDRPDY